MKNIDRLPDDSKLAGLQEALEIVQQHQFCSSLWNYGTQASHRQKLLWAQADEIAKQIEYLIERNSEKHSQPA